jgi:hypothetical protein
MSEEVCRATLWLSLLRAYALGATHVRPCGLSSGFQEGIGTSRIPYAIAPASVSFVSENVGTLLAALVLGRRVIWIARCGP